MKRPLQSFPHKPAIEGLIVLGARIHPQGGPGRVARLRLVHALQYWRSRDFQVYVLLTGGCPPGGVCSEARAMADWGLAWVSEQWGEAAREALEVCLILEEASRNTAASARNTLNLIAGRGSRAVGLVTDTVHMSRARLLFQQQFRPRGIVVHPLQARGLVRHYWRSRRYLWLAKMALREGGAWLKVLVQQIAKRPEP